MVMSERDVQDSLKFMREKLRKERKAQNMSQLTLSAEADLACNTICRIQCQNCSLKGKDQKRKKLE